MRNAKRAAHESRSLTRVELARKLEAAEKELAERRRIMAEEDGALDRLHKQEEESRELQPSVPLTGTVDDMYKYHQEKWWGGDSAEGIHLGIGPEGERKIYIVGDVSGGRTPKAGRLEGLETNHLRWGQIAAQRVFGGFIAKLQHLADRELIYSLMGGLNHNFAHHTPTDINLATTAAVINSTTRTMRSVNAANPHMIIYNVSKGQFVRDHFFHGSGTYLGVHKIDTLNPDTSINYSALRQFAAHYPMSEIKFNDDDHYEVFMITDGLSEPFRKGEEQKRKYDRQQFHQLVPEDVGTKEHPISSPLSPLESLIHDHFQAVRRGDAEDTHDSLAQKIYDEYGNQFVANEHENRLQMITVQPLRQYEHLLPPKSVLAQIKDRVKKFYGRRRQADLFSI